MMMMDEKTLKEIVKFYNELSLYYPEEVVVTLMVSAINNSELFRRDGLTGFSDVSKNELKPLTDKHL
jgi:hypothetical protein